MCKIIVPLSVWHSVGLIQCHPEWIEIEYVYVKTLQDAIVFVSCIFSCFASVPFHYVYTSILPWQRMAVNLCGAHKKTDSHAAHKVLLACFLL